MSAVAYLIEVGFNSWLSGLTDGFDKYFFQVLTFYANLPYINSVDEFFEKLSLDKRR